MRSKTHSPQEATTKACTAIWPDTSKQHRLLDALKEMLSLKNDARLAEALGLHRPVLSKLRSGKLPFGPTTIIAMHEETNLSTRELRALMENDDLPDTRRLVSARPETTRPPR